MLIKTWEKFARVIRTQDTPLLSALENFEQPILVAGCQRSGGTMLAHAFNEHETVIDFSWSKDAELDAAQVLCGNREPAHAATGKQRHCFQTTYLNERYTEYQEHPDAYYLVWLLRNPYSVVYSMLYNWKRFALNEVFMGCGAPLIPYSQQRRLGKFGVLGVPPILRACYAYLGKLEQLAELYGQLSATQLRVIEYEALVTNKDQAMAELCQFAGLSVNAPTGAQISTRSLAKADKFKAAERRLVESLCDAPYNELRNTLGLGE